MCVSSFFQTPWQGNIESHFVKRKRRERKGKTNACAKGGERVSSQLKRTDKRSYGGGLFFAGTRGPDVSHCTLPSGQTSSSKEMGDERPTFSATFHSIGSPSFLNTTRWCWRTRGLFSTFLFLKGREIRVLADRIPGYRFSHTTTLTPLSTPTPKPLLRHMLLVKEWRWLWVWRGRKGGGFGQCIIVAPTERQTERKSQAWDQEGNRNQLRVIYWQKKHVTRERIKELKKKKGTGGESEMKIKIILYIK